MKILKAVGTYVVLPLAVSAATAAGFWAGLVAFDAISDKIRKSGSSN